MEHFAAQDWADFVREATAEPLTREMRRHLDEGCAECAAAHKLWTAVAVTAVKEKGYEPPDASLAIVRAMYRVRQSALGGTAARARLIFDSFRQPLAAGVRSEAAGSRQCLWRRGRFRVDTRLEPGSGPNQMVLLGQVIERPPVTSRPSPPGGRPTVLLYAAERPLAAANANRFGEFHLEFEAARDLRLWVVITDEDPIEIRLRSDTAGRAAGSASGRGGH